MSSLVPTAACALLILFLLFLQREPKARTSWALWIPTLWVVLAMSRPLTAWLYAEPLVPTASQYVEGSPLDRLVLGALMLGGIVVLLCRYRRAARFLRANWPILLFFTFCAVSVLWSDFPGVALKRWVRASGDLTMVMIILTERESLAAFKRIIVRAGFLLVPLSILLIEFYPSLGQVYSIEDGRIANIGVTTNKNTLGSICMIIGLASVWRIIALFRENSRIGRQLIAHGSILAMCLWLLYVANSSTSKACFLLGLGMILFLNFGGKKRTVRAHLIVAAVACVALFIVAMPEAYASIVHALGRKPDLTGRTDLWKAILSVDFNHWFGTGYMSFWLGSRLQYLWGLFYFYPQEAHNGYLEIYINLGRIGLVFMGLLLAAGYRNVVAAFRSDPATGAFRLAFFVVALVYNFTEAAFRMNDPIWIFLLLTVSAIPSIRARKEHAWVERVDPNELAEGPEGGDAYVYEEIA
ncbi:MAG TPA: O-antigen ligase family protein [Terriglobia bacterium]|nr:O-antigen ligase family protein [Terriglobia bacterium]